MSEFRNMNDPNRVDTAYDPNVRGNNATLGWIAGGVFLVVVLALVFGFGHPARQTGQNMANNTPPVSRTIPAPAPSGPANPAFTPAPITPAPQAR